jgi:AraC-like DNA-binding protein/ligand-binding sensor protein
MKSGITPDVRHPPDMKPLITSHDRKLLEAIQSSSLYRSYQEAFRSATGMPLFLRSADPVQIPRAAERREQNEFCQALSALPGAGEACREAHARLCSQKSERGTGCSGVCFARMRESAIPLRCGGTTIGWLWTGQVFVSEGEKRSFDSVAVVLGAAGCGPSELRKLRSVWEATPELTPDKYRSVLVLLEAFARQLGELANRLVLESRPQEPAVITKARRYVHDHLTDRLTLEEIARHAGVSPHHFCKIFRRAVGINLIDYINRSRVELATQMLSKPDARVSEIAFEVGYQSLSQFNRSFRHVTGSSPTEFRRRLFKPSALRCAA